MSNLCNEHYASMEVGPKCWKCRTAELEAEVDRLEKVYEAGAEQTQRVLAKEVAENKRLREALSNIKRISTVPIITDIAETALEAGND